MSSSSVWVVVDVQSHPIEILEDVRVFIHRGDAEYVSNGLNSSYDAEVGTPQFRYTVQELSVYQTVGEWQDAQSSGSEDEDDDEEFEEDE